MRYRRFRYRYTQFASSVAAEHRVREWSEHPGVPVAHRQFRPPTDLQESASGLEAHVDLAGVLETDIQVTVHPDALIVEGERRSPAYDDSRFHHAEIRYGPFRVVIILPHAVDVSGATARYERGMLAVHLPPERVGEEEER